MQLIIGHDKLLQEYKDEIAVSNIGAIFRGPGRHYLWNMENWNHKSIVCTQLLGLSVKVQQFDWFGWNNINIVAFN
jgi:hypothetical protein